MQVSQNFKKVLMLIALNAIQNCTYNKVEIITPGYVDVTHGKRDDGTYHLDYGHLSIEVNGIVTSKYRICGINDHQVLTAGGGTWSYIEHYDSIELPPTFEYGSLELTVCSDNYFFSVNGEKVMIIVNIPKEETLFIEFFV